MAPTRACELCVGRGRVLVRRAACTRQIVRNRHWIVSGCDVGNSEKNQPVDKILFSDQPRLLVRRPFTPSVRVRSPNHF